MQNLIIKPATLTPSTYSQIGNTLIPSKDCNNRKIARKFTQRGPHIKKYIYGSNTIDKPFISTFKRFDRPSPLISTNCQNCKMVSVPSVTDKTIYPCSLGKYGVTGYSNGINKINNLGNSLYHRITTTNTQLYQQYRVTNKNNIKLKCCEFTLKTGIYNNGIINIAVFMDGCTMICIDNDPVTQPNVEDPCEYIIEGTDIIVEIISDNEISIDSVIYMLLPFENTSSDFGPETNNGKLIPAGIDCNSEDLIITDIQITNNNLSIKENGVTISIGNKYQEYTDPSTSEVFRFYQNKSAIYVFNENPSNYIIDKITCGCNYELCCKFTLQDGFYTGGSQSLPIISKDCDSICSELNYKPSLTNPCIYDNISDSSTLEIITDNEFSIASVNYLLNTNIQTASLTKDFDDEEFLLVPENSSNCSDITIKNVEFDNNGTLTFEENGNSINLGNQYYDIGNNQWGYFYNNTQFYYINDPNLDPNAPIARKFTCECDYNVFCCEFTLQTGFYKGAVSTDLFVPIIIKGCGTICSFSNSNSIQYTQSLDDSCKYINDDNKNIQVTNNNTIDFSFESPPLITESPFQLEQIDQSIPSGSPATFNNVVTLTSQSNNCPDITIDNAKITTNGELIFEETILGTTTEINLGINSEYILMSSNIRGFLYNNNIFYYIVIVISPPFNNNINILFRFDCDCFYAP